MRINLLIFCIKTMCCFSIQVAGQQSIKPAKPESDTIKLKIRLQYLYPSITRISLDQPFRTTLKIDLGKPSRIVEYRLRRNRHITVDNTSLGRLGKVPYHLMDNLYPRYS